MYLEWNSEDGTSELWIRRTVTLAREFFDDVARAYWEECWLPLPAKKPATFASWMRAISRDMSILVRELWIPQEKPFVPKWLPADTPRPFPMPRPEDARRFADWYNSRCGPEVKRTLAAQVEKWSAKARCVRQPRNVKLPPPPEAPPAPD